MQTDSSLIQTPERKEKKKKTIKNLGPLKWLNRPETLIGTTFFIFIFSQLIALILVITLYSALHPTTKIESLDGASPTIQLIFVALFISFYVLLVRQFLKWRGLKLADIGLKRRPRFDDITKGILGYAVFFVLAVLIMIAMKAIFPGIDTEQEQEVGFEKLVGSWDYIAAFIALVILPPIGEEILMRGYLYSGLRSVWKILPAALVTSFIFGIAHLQLGSETAVLWAAGINTFILSLVLVYLRENTGALYAGILLHAINNLIAFGVKFN